jgi:hypothetical protein
MSQYLPSDSQQRRRKKRQELRQTDPAKAHQLDREDRVYFHHTYLRRVERDLRRTMTNMTSNPRFSDVTRAYLTYLLARNSTEHLQMRFLKAIMRIDLGEDEDGFEMDSDCLSPERSSMENSRVSFANMDESV